MGNELTLGDLMDKKVLFLFIGKETLMTIPGTVKEAVSGEDGWAQINDDDGTILVSFLKRNVTHIDPAAEESEFAGIITVKEPV